MREPTHADHETLNKVYRALGQVGFEHDTAVDIVGTILRAGVFLREFPPDKDTEK